MIFFSLIINVSMKQDQFVFAKLVTELQGGPGAIDLTVSERGGSDPLSLAERVLEAVKSLGVSTYHEPRDLVVGSEALNVRLLAMLFNHWTRNRLRGVVVRGDEGVEADSFLLRWMNFYLLKAGHSRAATNFGKDVEVSSIGRGRKRSGRVVLSFIVC